MPQPGPSTNQTAQPQASYRLTTAAWLPVPVLLLIIVAAWAADWRTAFDAPYLLVGLNLGFLTLVPIGIAVLLARSFLIAAAPGVLLVSCGAVLWAAAGFAGACIVLASGEVGDFDRNTLVTIHNSCTWASAFCHLAGAALSIRWSARFLSEPRWWLAGAGAAVLAVVGFIVLASLSGWTPKFFGPAGGATPVRQFVLGSAVAMFLLCAALLREGIRLRQSAFVAWYAIALQLLAIGILGWMFSPPAGSVLRWAARATQYLGGCYMLVAALAATRAPGGSDITFGPVRRHPLHIYGIAAALVIAATILRLVFMPSLGTRAAFLTFYPAIVLAALYAGLRAGLLATALSVVLANYFWIEPVESLGFKAAADVQAMTVFVLGSVMISWVVESMHRALARRRAAEAEQKRLNRSLRLLSDCNLAMARAETDTELLDDVCRLFVESGGYLMAWAGVPEQDARKSVTPVAQFGFDEGYLESIRVSWDGEQAIGCGPTGMAIRTGSTQVVQDYLTSPNTAPWRAAALQRGYQASVGLPLVSENTVLAALTIYAREPSAFGVHEIRLLEELASNVAYGLRSLCARSELQHYQQELEDRVAERTREISELNEELQARASEAESANRAKGAFLATMSHEIRTPLNAVVGLTGLLSDSPLDRRQRDYADKIRLSAEALCTLIDDILDFSKIEARALRLEEAPYSLNAILRTTAVIVSAAKRGKPIEALFDVAPDVPDQLIGDALRLQQILLNLTSNAIKFTEAGQVVVSVRRLAQEAGRVSLQFSIRDTGIGIPPEQLDHIFEVFAQADFSISRTHGGTGLGLAISARLADLMGSRIDVESTFGQGSEFSFILTQTLADLDISASSGASLPGLRVLIIDDHPHAREILKRDCTAFNWQATALDSGAAGLDELKRCAAEGRQYDLMLLDWRMPGMDGVEMLRRAYAAPDVGLPLVILMAGAFELEQAAAASDDLHLDGILAKPVIPASLRDAVASAHSGEFGRFVRTTGKTDRRLAGMRLLVAEDNEISQQVIEQVLTRAGAEVVLAGDGLSAVEALMAPGAQFDAVLMDIQMPVMDGYAATRVIREELGQVDLPIIAITAFAQPEDHEKSRRAGMSGHIVKPIDVEDLLDVVARERRRSPGEPRERRSTSEVQTSSDKLPGLDVAGALEAFGGNEKKYAEMLRKFTAYHRGDPDELRRLFSAGALDDAAKLVHKLRGAASLLHATDITRVAASIESTLVAGDAEPLPQLFDELQIAIDVLVKSIDQFATLVFGTEGRGTLVGPGRNRSARQ
jgi:signal transduction histidine kinase/DNA-binding response OmpR family regulator/HPt (histidine-containing phosphotransfer) domain-containing protein